MIVSPTCPFIADAFPGSVGNGTGDALVNVHADPGNVSGLNDGTVGSLLGSGDDAPVMDAAEALGLR